MSRHDTCITHKYQTPVQKTHCVSANDARALTQIDTNTAGTPNVKKKKKNYCENSVLVMKITNNRDWCDDGTPANDDKGPQVVLI